LLCSPEAADRLRGAGVDKWARGEEKASDHAPTWVEWPTRLGNNAGACSSGRQLTFRIPFDRSDFSLAHD
jgi:hypothetical protein